MLAHLTEILEKLLVAQNNAVWLTTEEAADGLKIGKQTIDVWRKADWFPVRRRLAEAFPVQIRLLDQDIEAK